MEPSLSLGQTIFFFGSVSIFMHSRCRHDANEIPLRTRRAWAIPVAFFKPPAGRTSFSSFRFAQFIAEAIHILRHLAPPTHTQSVYLARDQRLTTAHSCVFHFQAQVLFFLLRPIGKRFPRTGLDHNLKCQPRSALHEQVPLRETACLYFAPPSLRAQCAA